MQAALSSCNKTAAMLSGTRNSRAVSSRVHAALRISCRFFSEDAGGLRDRYGAKVASGELIDDR